MRSFWPKTLVLHVQHGTLHSYAFKFFLFLCSLVFGFLTCVQVVKHPPREKKSLTSERVSRRDDWFNKWLNSYLHRLSKSFILFLYMFYSIFLILYHFSFDTYISRMNLLEWLHLEYIYIFILKDACLYVYVFTCTWNMV